MIEKKKILLIFVVFILASLSILFLSWIIYFFVNDNSKNNVKNEEFLELTNSDLFYENDYEQPNKYVVLDYKNQNEEIFKTDQNDKSMFHPYYNNEGDLAFTWFVKNEDSEIIFYNEVYNQTKNFISNDDLNSNEPNNSLNESNSSINHEFIYKSDFDNNYYFIIDNLNTWQGKENDDNGGLGDLSVQQVDIIEENTNDQEIISISDLLNYSENYWYYIDEDTGEYYRTIMPSNDFFHFNSIDYYEQNIYVNSRTLGTFLSIKVLDENGNILNNPEVNWIYSGNYDSYYYLYEEDLDGDHSIIYNEEENKYIANSEYDPQETYDFHKNNGGLQDKFINWEINGNYYPTDNLENLRKIQNEEKEQLFMGEHCVKILNPYIEKVGPENFFLDPDAYDPNDLYFSMFDNHAEWGNTNLELQESLYKEEWYSHDNNSYIKIVEVNPNSTSSKTNLSPMTGRVILNHKTSQKSPTISSTLFFEENGNNYVAVDQGNGISDFSDTSLLSIYQFDKIDTAKQDFNKWETVYEQDFGDQKMIFRAYPIWDKLDDNVIVSWNG
ncbi:hypothetical protein [Candidatus Hepatoplasma crinochetorum]|uniref:Uncharacterized protein n=1 Tax=Candidatus Hepatoplasma crinochetorum Av TaxID=1427984 RepID=W8GNC1_9MOLU|nr:hypothetical protein [Candidatus Hepatoplasma crinochetorum]AHK22521.1 hypothetical protein X271_00416 [Candidatus Hepatoplasma crinochetorum Av]BDV03104.1 MAG: hypothetical protein HCTKY_3980 [Candidatus Hepatoplasma crinochetorum]